jgi:hypothetical protein
MSHLLDEEEEGQVFPTIEHSTLVEREELTIDVILQNKIRKTQMGQQE